MSAKICAVDDCLRPLLAKGLCNRHYLRQRATGSPTGSLHKTLEERFWAKVDKSGDCWEWTSARTTDGYGQIRDERQRSTSYAHRVSFQLAYGPPPDGVQIDHLCHNTSCVRPEHLRVATQKQNNEHRQLHPANKSGVRGVTWDERTNKWRAKVGHFGRQYNVGYFSTIEEAEVAVVAKRNELFTHNDLDRRSVA